MKTALLFPFQPREDVRYLNCSLFNWIPLFLSVALLNYLLFWTYVLSLPNLPLSSLWTFEGLGLIVTSLMGIGLGLMTTLYLGSLILWGSSKLFGGRGSFLSTWSAVHWAFAGTVPLFFFLLLIHYSFQQQDHGLMLRILAYAGVVATAIWEAYSLPLALAEAQQFSLWRAVVSLLFAFAAPWIISEALNLLLK